MNYILIGDSGHSKVITDIIQANGDCVIAKLDDKYKEPFIDENIIKGPLKHISNLTQTDPLILIAIGNNKIRQNIVDKLNLPNNVYGTIIHPSATVSTSANIAEGTVIMPNAVVNAEAVIGCHSIINSSAVVEHDCVIGNFVHIAPAAVVAGGAQIGNSAHIGPNATIDVLAKVEDGMNIQAGKVVYKL